MDFLKRIKDINTNCLLNDKSYLLDFLDLAEQELVRNNVSKELNVVFDGGYENAEYKRCFISKNEPTTLKIAKLKIKYNKRFLTLNHRHILGRLLSLGIKRNSIGDIIISDDSYIICKEELSDFIIDNFKDLDNNSVELIKVFDEITHEEEYIIRDIFISSMRLDNVIANAINVSRSKALEMIKSGFVKINQKITENSSQIVNVCDIISIRKYGRVKIFSIKGKTKSDNIVLQIGQLR